jgi:acetyl-CoA acyltransferase
VKSNGVFKKLSALDMASRVVSELLARQNLSGNEVDKIVYGQVVPAVATPNIAREIVLATGMPRSVDAYSVSRACATSTQSLVEGALAIEAGDADVVICGGADSLSRPPITFSDRFVEILMKANSARDPMSKMKAFLKLKPKDLLPIPPAIAEFSTGKTMGQCAEQMAKDNNIAREAQDELAARSHAQAAKAWADGIYADEVMAFPVSPGYKETADRDNLVRDDTNVEKLAKLRPAFDREYGSVTAGTSSPLTDGASAVILMSEEKAASLGYSPLAFVKSWGFAGIDPEWQLLMGPAFATPIALDRAGLQLSDVDLVDMHEAFAAQVLSNLQAFASKSFAQERLGRSEALGEVDPERLNIHGGSLSLGHPFAATGTRQALTMANELNRRGGGTALITQCAAGGLGAAVILER